MWFHSLVFYVWYVDYVEANYCGEKLTFLFYSEKVMKLIYNTPILVDFYLIVNNGLPLPPSLS